MAGIQADTTGSQHAENAEHEAILTGVIALANLFSNCVEAFGLIHAGHKWVREEQLLLSRLGIQQARLLIWGDVVGITSPPTSVTDRAVPKHPSAAYPDLKEPTFFGARDARLDDMETRKAIESALSAIVDRSATATREEMMEKYGLKPPKKFAAEYSSALDTNRLEAFRERYELLKEVAESYAHLNTRRNNSLVHQSWMIADYHKFDSFIKLTQEKIDFLISSMDVKERLDRAMSMDIRALGWHLSADRARIALDVSKLRMIRESSKDEYPEYLPAVQQALDNIDREHKENIGTYNPYATAEAAPVSTPHPVSTPYQRTRGSIAAQGGQGTPAANGATHDANGAAHDKHKSHGVFGGLFKHFGGRKSQHDISKTRSQSVSSTSSTLLEEDPERSKSDAGPMRSGPDDSMPAIEPIRSKSVGAILDAPINSIDDQMIKERLEKLNVDATVDEQHTLERLNTNATVDEPLEDSTAISSAISRHDQYHGLARQGTKEQW